MWPSAPISTGNLDSDADSPKLARADLKLLAEAVNAMMTSGIPPGLGGCPPGAVLSFAGTAAPEGWLMCYGQEVSRTTYAGLFGAIGTTYGSVGPTTFTLPDMRGRVPAGKDNMGGTAASRLTSAGSGVDGSALGASGGAQNHTLTVTEMPAHSHPVPQAMPAITNAAGSVNRASSNSPLNAAAVTDSIGGGGAHNNTQPTIVLNYIIKL